MRQILVITIATLLLTIGSARNCVSQWIKTDIASGAEALCFAQIGANFFAGMVDSGLYISVDNGATWTPSGLQGKLVWAIVEIGTNLFAGTSDKIGDGGVYRSTDNGTSWTQTNSAVSTAVFCLAVHGTILFAGSATGSGIFVSTNNGTTWNSETETGAASIQALVVSGSNVFAGTDQGMFLSSNNGLSWNAINSGLHQNGSIAALAVSGTNLFAGAYDGVYLSANNGATWATVSAGLTGINGISALAVSGSNIFAGSNSAGTNSGVFLSTNNGSLWTSVSTGATDSNVSAIGVIGSYLFCGTNNNAGVWRRPLSEMTGTSAVPEQPKPAAREAQAYPNPFSEKTTVRFTTAERGPVRVSVVNLLGVEVARLFEGELVAGEHSFEWDVKDQPRGAYFALIRTSNAVRRISLTLIR